MQPKPTINVRSISTKTWKVEASSTGATATAEWAVSAPTIRVVKTDARAARAQADSSGLARANRLLRGKQDYGSVSTIPVEELETA